MKKIPADSKFKVLGIYAPGETKGWKLLPKFNGSPFIGCVFPFSRFDHFQIKCIRYDEYWLYDFNGLTRESGYFQLRLKIRLIA